MASFNGNINAVKFLIKNCVNINIHTCNDYPIYWSARNNHFKIVKYLVKNGANVNARNSHIIVSTVEKGNLEILKFLFENGANYSKNYRAIEYAVHHGHLDIVQYLYEIDANICVNNNIIIKIASSQNHLKIVEYLLKYQFDNDDNLIFLLNEIYHFHLNFNENLIHKINVLLWCIKLDIYDYFEDHFNGKFEVYEFLLNNEVCENFENEMYKYAKFKNNYITLENICLGFIE